MDRCKIISGIYQIKPRKGSIFVSINSKNWYAFRYENINSGKYIFLFDIKRVGNSYLGRTIKECKEDLQVGNKTIKFSEISDYLDEYKRKFDIDFFV